MGRFEKLLSQHERVKLIKTPTPLERLDRLSDHLLIDLWIKRDDLTSVGFGGNKIRQLEYYFGAALAEQADTILITGAVQSNFVRAAAAIAAKLGLKAILQLENRVDGQDHLYETSGNVLLSRILGAEHMYFPVGEDEAGADNALRKRAAEIRDAGGRPYVIPLGLNNPPKGALGYMQAAKEILAQADDFEAIVVASGSGATHAGLLAGLRLLGCNTPVFGICVRRDAVAQMARMTSLIAKLTTLLGGDILVDEKDIICWDGALAPGYGRLGPASRHAMQMMAQMEGIFLDPVYTAKSFAGVLGLLKAGDISSDSKVLFVHTGGQPAIFAYQSEIEG